MAVVGEMAEETEVAAKRGRPSSSSICMDMSVDCVGVVGVNEVSCAGVVVSMSMSMSSRSESVLVGRGTESAWSSARASGAR